MPGELRVDTAPLASGGQGLLSAAGDIPLPPVPFTAAGGDALSTILNARTQAIEAPLIAGMPVTKAEALRTAQNIIQAAGIYERVDQQIADQSSRRWPNSRVRRHGAAGADGSAVLAVAARVRPARLAHRRLLRRRPRLRRRGRAAGGSDGPVDGHADADGIAGCPDTNAIGGHGGVDSAGDHAGRAERDAAGRPNGRRRRGRDRSGVGSTGRRVTGRGEARRIRRGETGREGSAVDSFRGCCRTEQRGTGTGDRAAATPSPDVPQQPHKPAPTRPATSGPESVL